MSAATEVGALLLVLVGATFFTAGTIGLIRFPDVRSQLHAVTKADNLGLGLILAGVALLLGSWMLTGLLLLTWLLALCSAAVSAQLLGGLEAQEQRRDGETRR